ncbi:MAG: hypothetical protein OEY09_08355, partial [Gammaproteobacteria bacterium]|nr:hypothetical protein [Gammaproteobacteria bacterium]
MPRSLIQTLVQSARLAGPGTFAAENTFTMIEIYNWYSATTKLNYPGRAFFQAVSTTITGGSECHFWKRPWRSDRSASTTDITT